MTVCAECGGPTDPDTIHIQHSETCWLNGCLTEEGCLCDEVCAECCQDPDCPLPGPGLFVPQPGDPHMTDPLTDDDELLDRIDDWADDADTGHEYVGRDLLYETWHQVTQARKERDEALRSKEALIRKVKRLEDRCAVLSGALEPHDLRTQAEQARRERDDADAVIQRLDGGWMPDDSCDGPTWYLESGIDDDPDEFDGIEPMTPGEVDAIRRARAVPGAEEDQ